MAKTFILFVVLSSAAAGQESSDDDWGDEWAEEERAGLQWTGFIEGALGSRWDRDPRVNGRGTLRELRARVETDWANDRLAFGYKGDLLYDDIDEDFDLEIRDLTLAFSPVDSLDVRVGRQVLTWGTGDYLFLNDLFPKDWVSFFAGREDEYLKAPSDSVRFVWYSTAINVDFAWTPVFEPDDYLTGRRFSSSAPWLPVSGVTAVSVAAFSVVDEPDKDVENGEFALRLFRNFSGTEAAIYGYRGFFKQPVGRNRQFMPNFPALTAIGGSLRRSQWSGLINAETSYYFSRDDRSGTNPQIPNDQLRFLIGYEREAVRNFTIGVQYYLEWTQDHDELIANSATPQFEPDEYRHLVTSRLTYRAMMDKLTWSLFLFWSPSDKDYYLRPKLTYRYSDQWAAETGASLFGGSERQTFFGQLEDNDNAYVRVRYNF